MVEIRAPGLNVLRFAKSVPLRTTSELAISRCPNGQDI
jgi:hypothetical protein